MTKNDAIHIIDEMGVAKRENRENAARLFWSEPESLNRLVPLTFDIHYKNHHKAAWILEIIAEWQLSLLYPYLDFYCENLSNVKNASAIRPLTKINRWLCLQYSEKKDSVLQNVMKMHHLKQLTEVSFDWMIGDYPTAPKSFSMDVLYILGKIPSEETYWIHEALKNVILQQLPEGTPGFKNHGMKIVAKLEY